MRAKRSKKYRKIMATYSTTFSFRPPFQVLCDAAFIRACHAFHMPLQKSLENTLQGPCRLFMTKCTLAKVMKDFEAHKGDGREKRPAWLPPPTELPLRYCKHNDEEKALEEWRCLIDLVAGQPRGNEEAKNKQHFVLATAEASEKEKSSRGYVDVRERARMVPGVPIVYVKRSVMVLEELSGASSGVRRGVEREKFRDGLIGGGRKRKRGEDEEEDAEDVDSKGQEGAQGAGSRAEGKKRRGQKAKEPNPLSVPKKKSKLPKLDVRREEEPEAEATPPEPAHGALKSKRRRKHGGKKGADHPRTDDPGGDGEQTTSGPLIAHSRLQEVLG